MTTEVRRCSHCNEPAVIVVRRWGTSQLFGLVKSATVSRTDYRCQACGASFRVLPWHGVRTVLGGAIFLQLVGLFVFLVVCGAMLLTSDPGVGMALTLAATVGTVVFGVGFLWAVSSSWYVIRNPIVPDAPVPALRYGERDLSRRCTCGGVAPVHRVVANTTNGIPTGTDYFHVCSTCGSGFKVEDLWGLIFSTLAGTFVMSIALVLVPWAYREPEPSNLALTGFMGLMGAISYTMALSGVRALWLHPRIGDPPTGR